MKLSNLRALMLHSACRSVNETEGEQQVAAEPEQEEHPPPTPVGETYAARSAGYYARAYDWADAGAIEAVINVNLTNAAQVAAMGRLCDAMGVTRTIGRHALLRILFFTPEHRLTQVEVAHEMQVTSANVTFLVDGLEKEGLVRRVPSTTDRRTVYVELTDAGLAFAERIVPSLARYMARMLEGFSDEEKHTFCDMLDRVRRNAERFESRSID